MASTTLAHVAAAAPIAGAAACIAVTAGYKGSDYASSLGSFFRGLLALAAVCAAGEIAAIVALVRQDRPQWLAIGAAVVNALLTAPGLWVATRMDWD